jgi:hypothetical protein
VAWESIAEAELLAELTAVESALDPPALALWQMIRIRPVKWQFHPQGDRVNDFWVVAIIGRQCIWYNDIEGGFEISPFSEFGTIRECGARQFELAHCLRQFLGRLRHRSD